LRGFARKSFACATLPPWDDRVGDARGTLDKSQFPASANRLKCFYGASDNAVSSMKALILYVVFVVIGGLISVGVGYYVEKEVSSAASLVVFLALFFSNFAVSWIAVILAMDGNLKNAQGAEEQKEIERTGRLAMQGRD
jgi:hypothetical protein